MIAARLSRDPFSSLYLAYLTRSSIFKPHCRYAEVPYLAHVHSMRSDMRTRVTFALLYNTIKTNPTSLYHAYYMYHVYFHSPSPSDQACRPSRFASLNAARAGAAAMFPSSDSTFCSPVFEGAVSTPTPRPPSEVRCGSKPFLCSTEMSSWSEDSGNATVFVSLPYSDLRDIGYRD